MTNNDELERQKFEAAMKSKFSDLLDYSRCANGEGHYIQWDTQVAYYAWRVALSSKQEQSNG